MGSDLNTSMAVTAVFDALKAKTNDATKLALLADFDQVLGLSLIEKAAAKREAMALEIKAEISEGGEFLIKNAKCRVTPEISAMLARRDDAKKAKNYAEADRIRDELKAMGIEFKDIPGGVELIG